MSEPVLGPAFTALCDQIRTKRTNKLFKAIMLTRRIEDCEAMLRGEKIPLERLDPEWVRRFNFK